MFVIILNYVKAIETIEPLLPAHREFLDHGYADGVFICSGPRSPRFGGVILAQEKDRETLLKRMQQDPFYVHGVAEYQIIEFNPNKFNPKFDQALKA